MACTSSEPEGLRDAGVGTDTGAPTDARAVGDPSALGIVPPAPPIEPAWPSRARPGGDVDHEPCGRRCGATLQPCAATGWPEDLPDDRTVIYVRPGATAQGIGTRASPLDGLEAGLALARPGDVVALSRGKYAGPIRIPSGVALWGACAQQVEIAAPENEFAVLAPGAGAELRRVTLIGPGKGLAVYGSVSVTEVVIDAVIERGLHIQAKGHARARDLVVRRVRSGGNVAAGAWVESDGRLELERAAFLDGDHFGIRASGPGARVAGNSVLVRDTRIGPRGAGVRAEDGAKVVLRSASIIGSARIGAVAYGEGSEVRLEDTVVRDGVPDGAGYFGRGLEADYGGRVELSRGRIENSRDVGVFAYGGTVVLRDVAVVGTRSEQATGQYGGGIAAQEGAHVTLERARVADNRDIGVYADTGSVLELRDVEVRDTAGREDNQTLGAGLVIERDARLSWHRGAVVRNRSFGVVLGTRTESTISDLRIEETAPQDADGLLGRGLSVQAGAKAHVARVIAARNHEHGIVADGASTELDLEDVGVFETKAPPADDRLGRGIAIQQGARVSMARASLARNRAVALEMVSEGTELSFEDVWIRDTLPGATARTNFETGLGILIGRGAVAQGRRLRVEGSSAAGIVISEDSALTVDDLYVRRIAGRALALDLGRGIEVSLRSRLEARRMVVEDAHEVGVLAYEQSEVVLTHAVVRRVDVLECLATTCMGAGGGVGVASVERSSVRMETFLVGANALCGVQLARGGVIDLVDGEISQNLVGVNIQSTGYDIDRLTDGVAYRDNGSNLDSGMMPVPDASGIEGAF